MFAFDSGRLNYTISMCRHCSEYNKAVHDAGVNVLERQQAERAAMVRNNEESMYY